MRVTGKIESLSYGLIYGMGCIVAFFLSTGNPLPRMVLYTLCSWGYVAYWVYHYGG